MSAGCVRGGSRPDSWIRGLHEPSGVAIGARHAYVADTNAHRIAVVVELASGTVQALNIREN